MKTSLIKLPPSSTQPYYQHKHKRTLTHERLVHIFSSALVLICVFCAVYLLRELFIWHHGHNNGQADNGRMSLDLNRMRSVALSNELDVAKTRNANCRYWDCLSLYRCGQDALKIYVYPLQEYEDESSGKLVSTLTSEYYGIIKTIVRSDYYTSNPNEACLFMPSIDLLNEQLVNTQLAGRVLNQLPHWDEGKNHLIFNFITNERTSNNMATPTDKAIILGGNFDSWNYRLGFDISLPVWSPLLNNFDAQQLNKEQIKRKYKLVAGQLKISPAHYRTLQALTQENADQLLLLNDCKNPIISSSSSSSSSSSISSTEKYAQQNVKTNVRCSSVSGRQSAFEYPRVLAKGTFCLVTRNQDQKLGQPDLLEILAHNCIPVIAIDNYVLPFVDVIDWTLAVIRIRESDLHSIMQRLNAISMQRISEFQQQISWLYQRYFSSLASITLTALEVLQERLFPHHARSLHHWNTDITHSVYRFAQNPLFMPLISSRAQGFTAVILTYDRVDSLFTLIQKLAAVPSLQSILVIWNNQRKSPPLLSAFPAISKPLKVIHTRANKLSNRFFPYAEIETEAILTIDDDINMLTADELDFGFEVWREFPDRIVGFPSRIHVWDNVTQQWRYESEWTNEISMVLTGAAFHHKIWSHMYTYNMPYEIKQWVDEHMNCEDIAMNFLVANITNQPPIKVTPRKKFKCPQCINTEMLSADLNHMRERSACIHRFSQQYGRMPLRSVEFRADPVLFRDNFPEKLKRFNNIGSL